MRNAAFNFVGINNQMRNAMGCLFLVIDKMCFNMPNCLPAYDWFKNVKSNYCKVNRGKKGKTGKWLFLANSFHVFGKLWRLHSPSVI